MAHSERAGGEAEDDETSDVVDEKAAALSEGADDA